MKKIVFALLLISISISSFAQTVESFIPTPSKEKKSLGIGIKAGYNYAGIAGKTPTVATGNKSGFMIAGFYSPAGHGVIGYRTEFIFSQQGFSYDADGKKQNVTNNYIYMPHFTTISIGKVVQLQVGGQVGYLINAKSSAGTGEAGESITSYYNRFDYGAAGGLEVYPFKGLILGSRYNVSFGNMFSNSATGGNSPFPFDPFNLKGKNTVLQFFAGYKF